MIVIQILFALIKLIVCVAGVAMIFYSLATVEASNNKIFSITMLKNIIIGGIGLALVLIPFVK